jgi:hypothetical protein
VLIVVVELFVVVSVVNTVIPVIVLPVMVRSVIELQVALAKTDPVDCNDMISTKVEVSV